MSILNDLEISCTCSECNEKKYLLSEDIDFTCAECDEKRSRENLESYITDLIDEIEEAKIRYISGEDIIGFENEKEKNTFLKGIKLGFQKSIYKVSDLASNYDVHLDEKIKSLENIWKEQKVNSQLSHPDKHRCNQCKGTGYTIIF